MIESKINNSVIRLQKDDLTAMDIEAIVHYARKDLALGAGFGSAIAARGGMGIQDELKPFGTLSVTDVVVTSAGQLNSEYIIHAVGPRFQEASTEDKLRLTVKNTLKAAEEKGIKRIAFPPLGVGFYGIPLDLCARVMLEVITDHASKNSSIEEIVICVLDNREFRAFQNAWESNKILGEHVYE
jgi:O-acetyl-ADP-ribose deacetylase (regulator of RNase III)